MQLPIEASFKSQLIRLIVFAPARLLGVAWGCLPGASLKEERSLRIF